MSALKDLYGGLRRENYILFFGCIVTRFGSMVETVITLILNQKMGFTASQVSFYMVALGLADMFFCMIGGKLSDKFNKKRCIIAFDMVSVILYVACFFIELNMLTLLFISMASVAQFAESPVYDALIADITKPENRSKAYALQYLGINIGSLFAPTLAGILFKNHLSLLFLICGIAIGTSTLLIASLVKNIEAEKITSVMEERRDNDSIFKILRDNKILFIYLTLIAIYGACYNQYGYLIPLDLGRMYGENGALLFGTINSTNCIIVVVFSPIMLYALSKIKPQWKMFSAQIMVSLGYIVYLFFITKIPAYYIAIILFTFGEILESLGSRPFITALTPASHRGRINGLRDIMISGANSIMLIISGFLYDHKGYYYSWAMVMFVIFAVITTTMIMNRKIKD